MNLEAYLSIHNRAAEIRLFGDLDEDSVPLLRSLLHQAGAQQIERVVLKLDGLATICTAGIRCLVSAQQTMSAAIDMVLLGARPPLAQKLRMAGLTQLFFALETAATV
jgi:anti-anti-sigma factor